MVKRKVVWLCTGDILESKKKNKPCIYAIIGLKEIEVPLFATSTRTRKYQALVIYCKKKIKNITHWVSMCNDFQNTTLIRKL